MARPTSLLDQATTNAAEQAQGHLPTELPAVQAPPEPPTVPFPEEALVHLTGVSGHLPDWLLGG